MYVHTHAPSVLPQLISTWFKYGRGVALGTIIGGLALGSALPHLIVGAGGVGDRWRIVTYSTSVLALFSGALVLAFVPTGEWGWVCIRHNPPPPPLLFFLSWICGVPQVCVIIRHQVATFCTEGDVSQE